MVKERITPNKKQEALLRQIPDDLLFQEAKDRYDARRREEGPYFMLKKIRACKGCNRKYTARMMRTHPCKISWPNR
jgi:hypothetical protein